jgi:hypothetical protein
MPTAPKWYEVHENLVSLAEYLADHGATAHELVSFIEKPWKYEDEWNEYQAENAAALAEDEARIAGSESPYG